MNKVYIIKEMTEDDYYDGEYDIPVTTIIEEAELISTIIPADKSEPFYEVVPLYTINEYDEIREQKPIFSFRQGIKKSTNSIYVTKIFLSDALALEASYNRNIEIIENRSEGFRNHQEYRSVSQFELLNLQEKVTTYHELEKQLNPNTDDKTIDYYTKLLDTKFEEVKSSSKAKKDKGRTLIYENKNNN